MSLRSSWQTLYLIQECSNIDGRADFGANSTGIGGILSGPDNNRFSLNPNFGANWNMPTNKLIYEESTGTVYKLSNEYKQSVVNPPTINITMPMSVYSLRLVLNSLLQNQSSSVTGIKQVNGIDYDIVDTTISIYSSSKVSKFLSLINPYSNNVINDDKDSLEFWGGLFSSVSITGSEGELISISSQLTCTRVNRTNVLGVISNEPRIKYLKSDGTLPIPGECWVETSPDNWIQLTSSIITVNSESDFTNPDDLSAGTVEMSYGTGTLNFSSSDLSTYSGKHIAIKYIGDGNHSSRYYDLPISFDIEEDFKKFNDLTCEIDGSNISISSFNLSLSNNLMLKFYDRRECIEVKLGRISSRLILDIPNDDSTYGNTRLFRDYDLEQLKTIYLYWGNKDPQVENDISFKFLGKLISLTPNMTEDIYKMRAVFELISDSESTVPFEAYLMYLAEYSGAYTPFKNIVTIWDVVM